MTQYLLSLLVVELVGLYLCERNKCFNSPIHALKIYSIFLIIGVIWDSVAVYIGWWSFNSEYLIGPHFGLLPIEEILFIIIIPTFVIGIYEEIEY